MFQSAGQIVRSTAAVLALSAALWAALISIASAEIIRSFNSDIVINEDSSFTVTETIVYDFELESRHGIFRNIKDKHPQEASVWYKTRYIDLGLLSVTRDGQPEPYTLESYNGLSVKIGDANRTITGPHTYQIVYRVEGGLAEYPDGIEVYWNVTGDEWPVFMEKVLVTLHTEWENGLTEVADCYVGFTGSAQNCLTKHTSEETRFAWEEGLVAGMGVTVAQRLQYGRDIVVLEQVNFFWIAFIALACWFVGFSVWAYKWHFKYRTKLPVIAQYEPLSEFKPMFTGVLFDRRLDQRDITAAIIYLAQRGYIQIKQTTEKVLFFNVKDHEVKLQKPILHNDLSFDDEIAGLLFRAPEVGREVIKLSDVKSNNSKLLANQKILQKLNKAVERDILEKGFIEQRFSRTVRLMLLIVVPLVSGILTALFFFFYYYGVESIDVSSYVKSALFTQLLGVSFFVTALLWFFLASERRTKKGYEALNYLKGFKDFLSTTEKERYKFHNAPALSPEKFMEYLPYAIAFGVEQEWAEVFKDIQITPPNWYQADTGGHFSATAFAAGLGSFSTSLSTSTGKSGSSGGGHSGGGGGGGGGGSW